MNKSRDTIDHSGHNHNPENKPSTRTIQSPAQRPSKRRPRRTHVARISIRGRNIRIRTINARTIGTARRQGKIAANSAPADALDNVVVDFVHSDHGLKRHVVDVCVRIGAHVQLTVVVLEGRGRRAGAERRCRYAGGADLVEEDRVAALVDDGDGVCGVGRCGEGRGEEGEEAERRHGRVEVGVGRMALVKFVESFEVAVMMRSYMLVFACLNTPLTNLRAAAVRC
ncbi:hypothetical protein IWX90DRAFT_426424 [Phyllosticta citrichinensis]|uniref:Uncharacterized protein n=1 Tax=Phyllosticta citrichinensis TaxID=1130410 RepID=A0ABR1XYG8_9PEZI